MKKTILALLMIALLGICTSAFAIDRNSEIAIMDFGTRPGATEAEISLNNAEYVTSEYIIDRLVDDKCFLVKEKDFVMGQVNDASISTLPSCLLNSIMNTILRNLNCSKPNRTAYNTFNFRISACRFAGTLSHIQNITGISIHYSADYMCLHGILCQPCST